METTIPPTDQSEPKIENPIQQPSPYGSSSTMLVIPRALVNYIIIGVVCFTLGAVVGGGALVTIFNANSVENRQIVADAVAAVAQNQVAQQPVGLQQGERYDVPADDDPTRGDPNAPITIVEFGDFRCQYCGKFFKETMEPLLQNYDGSERLHRAYGTPPEGGRSRSLAIRAGSRPAPASTSSRRAHPSAGRSEHAGSHRHFFQPRDHEPAGNAESHSDRSGKLPAG